MIKWIGFDADDTLWKNEEIYLRGRREFFKVLSKYGIQPQDLDSMDDFEVENIQYYGYGVMSFVLSMIEIAIEVTGEQIHPGDIQQLINLAKEMLTEQVEVFDDVVPLLEELSSEYPLLLITKGDLLHQQRKISMSGLTHFFRAVEIVSDKTPETYQHILDRYQISPGNFVMIGNSLRSDILPVLQSGGWAIHLTDHPTWSHEDDPLAIAHPERYLKVKGISQIADAMEILMYHAT